MVPLKLDLWNTLLRDNICTYFLRFFQVLIINNFIMDDWLKQNIKNRHFLLLLMAGKGTAHEIIVWFGKSRLCNHIWPYLNTITARFFLY